MYEAGTDLHYGVLIHSGALRNFARRTGSLDEESGRQVCRAGLAQAWRLAHGDMDSDMVTGLVCAGCRLGNLQVFMLLDL
jgi:hypothetical protein